MAMSKEETINDKIAQIQYRYENKITLPVENRNEILELIDEQVKKALEKKEMKIFDIGYRYKQDGEGLSPTEFLNKYKP